jgi:hypothetical protein
VPELGQVVRCRDRVWTVNEVTPSALPPDPIAGTRPQHLIHMSSIEDDGFGDELTVIWELEAGTRVIPHQELPRPVRGRLDSPGRLDAFLDAIRWGAVATADSTALQAPFRSGISIEEYQLDPVVRALAMPRPNLLIADDVGLGKTIEAGLVVQELLLRHRARTVLVVCPAGLCVKWQEEMLERFGLEFRIVNTDALRQLRRDRGVGANVFTSFPTIAQLPQPAWLSADLVHLLDPAKPARGRIQRKVRAETAFAPEHDDHGPHSVVFVTLE